ncbi:MFS transporter [Lentisphaera profundi]|uniref:MFS transporter n=1 Tax=Lentisphaera profundi TaxID=1658616 RepID=A0ABY7VZB1_9BACT|nr:MFS transporter [Lentisphaera profundi]WDE98609.1 MFS transporter [Lentisphaera profundi]
MSPDPQNKSIITKLSIMMFLQFFIWGAWYVTAPNFLVTIGFGAEDFGWTYSVGPIAGMITPLFVGMIADRFFPAQIVMGVMHLLGATFMFLATGYMDGNASATTINWFFFGHMLSFYPTLALTNTIAMKNMTNSEKQFPIVRVFGTAGWIVAGLSLSWFAFDNSINMFKISASAAAILGVFSFMLPNTPPVKSDKKITAGELLGLNALALLKDRSYLIFMISSILICIPLAFYYQMTSRIVQLVGLPIGQTMSYGQMSEVLFMLVMPLFFARLGIKKMLFLGMLCWVIRYALFAIGTPQQISWMIIVGIIIHGICYDFFFVTGQIYTDRVAPEKLKGQAQGLLVLLTLGVGMFIGAQVASKVEAKYTPPVVAENGKMIQELAIEIKSLTESTSTLQGAELENIEKEIATLSKQQGDLAMSNLKALNWKMIWGIPAVMALIVLIFFTLFFKEPQNADDPQAELTH